MSRQREAALQKQCHALMAKHSPEHALFFSIPNEGRRSGRNGAEMNRMGRLKGVADYFILTSQCQLFIEFKVDKDAFGGKRTYQSPEQKAFEARCVGVRAMYRVVRSVEEFLDACWMIGLLTNVSVTAGGCIRVGAP